MFSNLKKGYSLKWRFFSVFMTRFCVRGSEKEAQRQTAKESLRVHWWCHTCSSSSHAFCTPGTPPFPCSRASLCLWLSVAESGGVFFVNSHTRCYTRQVHHQNICLEFWHHVDESKHVLVPDNRHPHWTHSWNLLLKSFIHKLKSFSQFSEHLQPFDNYNVTLWLCNTVRYWFELYSRTPQTNMLSTV